MMTRVFMMLAAAAFFLLGALMVPALAGNPFDFQGIVPQPASPFDVGGRAQLFIDRTLIRDTSRVSFTLHQGTKHPQNPLLRADQPWEGWRLEIYGNVLYDDQEQCFKMWYVAADNPTCYATSKDGIHWQKPLVGTVDDGSGKPNNIVLNGHLTSVVKDNNEPDPKRRYKMTCWYQSAYRTMVSADGLHWELADREPFATGWDVVTGHWDPYRKLWIAFTKNHDFPWRGHPRRVFDLVVSRDFQQWSKPIPAFYPDLRDDAGSLARIEQVRPILDRPDDPALMRTEFYGIGAYPHESCTITFPWVLTINNNARWGNHEGPMEVQLAVSRDLHQWHRPFRTPVIDVGKPGDWDCGMQFTASSAIRVGDEIWLYYTGANHTHGSPVLYRSAFEDGKSTGRKDRFTDSIGLVTWKLDRFVSADGPFEGGTLTTVPICFSGKRMEINARTEGKGSVVVELLDAAGNPLNGFPKSDPFSGDALRHSITFGGSQDVEKLAGKPITLRFYLKDAKIFSFAFRNNGT